MKKTIPTPFNSFIPVAVLDTNVLYSIILRDILFWLAYMDLYHPKWSEQILHEWRNVLSMKGINENEIQHRISLVNKAFPNALVHKIKLINVSLPDINDIHIFSCAVKANANYIVTLNLKDFPLKILQQFQVIAISPDEFIYLLILNNPEKSKSAIRQLILAKQNPSITLESWRVILKKNGLIKTEHLVSKLFNF